MNEPFTNASGGAGGDESTTSLLPPKPKGTPTERAARLLKRAAWHFEQAWKCARQAQEINNKSFPGQGGAHARVKPSYESGSLAVRAALKRLTGSGQ